MDIDILREDAKGNRNKTYRPSASCWHMPGQPVGEVQMGQSGGSAAATTVAQAARIAVMKMVPRIVGLRVGIIRRAFWGFIDDG